MRVLGQSLLVMLFAATVAPTHGVLMGRLVAGEIAGASVTPHVIDRELKYRRPHEEVLAARVQLFVRGPAGAATFDGRSPADLLQAGDWSWHDLGTSVPIPEGAMGVWTFNGRTNRWGCGQSFRLAADGIDQRTIPIDTPVAWVSSVTFLSREKSQTDPRPDQVVVHVENASKESLRLRSIRLHLPREAESWQVLWPGAKREIDVEVLGGEQGFFEIETEKLPLGYAAIEIETDQKPLWAHLRVKRESFDISGGWIFDSEGKWREADVRDESGAAIVRNDFLDLLSSMHINTAHYEEAKGYSDQPQIMQRNPLKRFHRLWPTERWSQPAELATVHAVEFLGEPQYGGGKPVPPQEVFDQLLPYRSSPLATSVTHSEERVWRFYAGLSDYPHFDAYRVVAPAADSWRLYDRWGEGRITWGAPLETIGNLCRSLRELNRPMPCAVWSQGPHDGWGGGFWFGKTRQRRSPNADELRSQAMHALASRVTSLYWFNLSKPSLDRFPDTHEAMRLIGREIRMLEPLYLRGDAYRFRRLPSATGGPDWELSSIIGPQGAVLFALDTAYGIDNEKLEFVFGPPREAKFEFELPAALSEPTDVFRVDAEGIHQVDWRWEGGMVKVSDLASRDRIYVATKDPKVRQEIEERRQAALRWEASFGER